MKLLYGSAMTDATDSQLAAQYEAYPYPERDPRDERKRLIIGSPSHLREIDWWVFGGRRAAGTPFHALLAGGGTGDGTIMLATHLARDGRDGSVTYLDRSAKALGVARARAESRGLTNIDFRQGSLLDLPKLGLGRFDYIDCCGVLHHLPEPSEGLAALDSALAPGGGMGLMVYAPHGRTGVYMLQDALRLLAPAGEAPSVRLEVAKRVMRHLPASAWLRFNRNFADHITGGDAGLYDLLLNPRDRAYDITAFSALLGGSGLEIAALIEPARYDPSIYLPDPKLRQLAAGLDAVARMALAESLCANISTHVAYVVRQGAGPVRLDAMDPRVVPVLREGTGAEIAQAMRPDGVLPFLFDGLAAPVPLPRLAGAILRRIDGVASVGEIEAALGHSGFQAAWRETWERLNAFNRVFLRG